jgi:cell wall-associated protease
VNKKSLLILCALTFAIGLLSAQARSATIAIIDSGTDMKHEMIVDQAWINPVDVPGSGRDEDRNGYPDDIHGWNFAEGNNQVIDYKYLPLFDADMERFFEIQTKALLGTMTPEEREWIIAKIEDEEFLKKAMAFGNFMHGTHVGHIGIRNAPEAKLLAVKLIPTEVELPFYLRPAKSMLLADDELDEKSLRMRLLRSALGFLAGEQMKGLEEIAAYVDFHGAAVANGSFGTGYAQAKMIVELLARDILRADPTEEEIHEAAVHFLTELVKAGEKMVALAPETLFVFASGNDGTDNDIYPSSPTNIRASNSISVGATTGYGDLAVFSNFGATTVDVVAPGVAVRAAIPGDDYLRVSGTSQAAPYVASMAAQIKSTNPALTPAQIREIIMTTVDVRPEFQTKVVTSGIVNRDRATRAAELSQSMALSDAIIEAQIQVADLEIQKQFVMPSAGAKGLVMPLPSPFALR